VTLSYHIDTKNHFIKGYIMKNKPARFTIDIPSTDHKRLKALAALHGKTMRELVMQSIRLQIQELESKKLTSILSNQDR